VYSACVLAVRSGRRHGCLVQLDLMIRSTARTGLKRYSRRRCGCPGS
jgi:hypothetical protein